jgi:hypothetical protein
MARSKKLRLSLVGDEAQAIKRPDGTPNRPLARGGILAVFETTSGYGTPVGQVLGKA